MQVIPFSSIFFIFLNHCCYYWYFLRQTFLSPSHWVPCPAHSSENHFLGCIFLQGIFWEVYQEREFNVQESSCVRGWECSCLAKTFQCSRSGSGQTSQLLGTLQACCPSPLWSRHSLCTQLLLQAWSLLIPISVSSTQSISSISESLLAQNSQSTNESSRADGVRKQKIKISTDFSWTETLLIWGMEHQWVLPALVMSDVVWV